MFQAERWRMMLRADPARNQSMCSGLIVWVSRNATLETVGLDHLTVTGRSRSEVRRGR